MNNFLKALFGSTKHKAPQFRARLSVQDLEGRHMMDAALMAELARPIESSMAQVRSFDDTTPSKYEIVVPYALGSNVKNEEPAPLKGVQITALKSYFKTNDDIANFLSEPAKLLKNDGLNNFFSKFADGLLAIRAAAELADANDLAVAKMVAQHLGNKVIERLVPNFSKAFSVYGWAKTGMELMKGFVTDPAQEAAALLQYSKLREVHGRHTRDAAQDSFASLNNIGHIHTMGKERFKEMYSEHIFVEGTDQLLPPWQRRFEKYLNQWFEGQYQLKLLEETKAKLNELSASGQDELPGWDEYMMYELKNTLDIKVRVNPSKPKPFQSVQATIQIKGVKDFSRLDLRVTYSVQGSDGYTQEDNVAIDATGFAYFTIPGGAKGVKDVIKVQIVDTTVEFENIYNF